MGRGSRAVVLAALILVAGLAGTAISMFRVVRIDPVITLEGT